MIDKTKMNVLEPIDTKNLTDTIRQQLEDRIVGGELKEGDKLPSEQELAFQAGVGRRAIREALKALEMKGLVDIRKGSGAFVVRNDFDSYIETLMKNIHAYLSVNRANLGHLLQLRSLIAGRIIGMLASSPNQEIIGKIETTVMDQKRALSERNASLYNRAHMEFHFTIVDSIENPIASMIYRQVLNLLEPYMKSSGNDLDDMKARILEHTKILNAVKKADPLKAQKAFDTHMKSCHSRLDRRIEA